MPVLNSSESGGPSGSEKSIPSSSTSLPSQFKVPDNMPVGAFPPFCFNLGPGSSKKKSQHLKRPVKSVSHIQQSIPTQGVRSNEINRVTEIPAPSMGSCNIIHSSIPLQPPLQSNTFTDTSSQASNNKHESKPLQDPLQLNSSTNTPSQASVPDFFSPMSLCSPIDNTPTPVSWCGTKVTNNCNDKLQDTYLFSVGSPSPSSGLQSSRSKVRIGRRSSKVSFSSPRNSSEPNKEQISTRSNDIEECPANKQGIDLPPNLARAVYLREEARIHYSSGLYKVAILMYSEAIMIATKSSPSKAANVEATNSQTYITAKERELSLMYANRAAALLMIGAFEAAAKDCKNAMKYVDRNEIFGECGVAFVAKLYCRMARSFLKIGNIEEAQNNFNLAVSFSDNAIKRLESENSVVQQLNRAINDATIGLGEVRRCQEAMKNLQLNGRSLHSLEKVLQICPGLEKFHEKTINLLADMKRWSDVSLHCEKFACEVVRLDGVFTADLHPLNPFPGVEEAKHLKADYFADGSTYEKKLPSKAVAEAVLRLPNSILPFYLRALRLEERYTEAARACTSLEELSNSSSPRFRLKQGGRPAYSWLATERDRLRRTVATKDRGDTNFKNGDYRIAAINYTHCLSIDAEVGSLPNHTSGGRLHAVLFCNRAACYMAMRKYQDASNDCTSALAIQVSILYY